ncbi:hypothetical protein [Prevotella jejuni]|uniref:Uncharacterized protein n=1 Tax=Prevotella histicola TaxID=470565 RepID=A0A930HZQ9_9BACT|nr:hypothetical protein [Prevotella jejuni]MBF1415946.1 hypothetical protein [Prevotella histicola]MBW4771544.1 hypothetical protein [Prevotella jejuni]
MGITFFAHLSYAVRHQQSWWLQVTRRVVSIGQNTTCPHLGGRIPASLIVKAVSTMSDEY